MIAAATSAFAAEYVYSVIVNKTDGSKVEYKFSENPVATIEGDNMKMTYEGGAVLYPFAEIVNLTFEKEESGVSNVADSVGISFAVTKERLEASGLESGTTVSVYDASGQLVAGGTAGADGTVTISIASLGSGVHVVSAGRETFKFVR